MRLSPAGIEPTPLQGLPLHAPPTPAPAADPAPALVPDPVPDAPRTLNTSCCRLSPPPLHDPPSPVLVGLRHGGRSNRPAIGRPRPPLLPNSHPGCRSAPSRPPRSPGASLAANCRPPPVAAAAAASRPESTPVRTMPTRTDPLPSRGRARSAPSRRLWVSPCTARRRPVTEGPRGPPSSGCRSNSSSREGR